VTSHDAGANTCDVASTVSVFITSRGGGTWVASKCTGLVGHWVITLAEYSDKEREVSGIYLCVVHRRNGKQSPLGQKDGVVVAGGLQQIGNSAGHCPSAWATRSCPSSCRGWKLR